jgi:hypothetical protein
MTVASPGTSLCLLSRSCLAEPLEGDLSVMETLERRLLVVLPAPVPHCKIWGRGVSRGIRAWGEPAHCTVLLCLAHVPKGGPGRTKGLACDSDPTN